MCHTDILLLITSLAVDTAQILTPARWARPISILPSPGSRNAHLTPSSTSLLAASLRVHKPLFLRTNVSGDGSSLTDMGTNSARRPDNS